MFTLLLFVFAGISFAIGLYTGGLIAGFHYQDKLDAQEQKYDEYKSAAERKIRNFTAEMEPLIQERVKVLAQMEKLRR
jgi:hypothetical protein